MPATNGFVPTPQPVADYAAADVFGAVRPPEVEDGRLLLPGLGTGNLAAAARRYTTPGENWYTPQFDYEMPDAVGVENDPDRVADLRADRPDLAGDLTIEQSDFLQDPPAGRFNWALMNPPYTRYNRLDQYPTVEDSNTYVGGGPSVGCRWHIPRPTPTARPRRTNWTRSSTSSI